MSTDTQEIAGSPAPVASETQNPEQNTPKVTATEGDVESQEQAEKPAKTFTQAEVDAAIQKRLAKKEREVTRRLEQQLREALQSAPKEEPKRESFRDDDEFIRAQIEHRAEQRATQLLEEQRRRQEHERQQSTYSEKAEKAAEKYEDFDIVMERLGRMPIPDQTAEAMAEFIADSEIGPDVAYFLGKNPAKAREFASMSPVKAAKELIRIEKELSDSSKPHQSSAPKPLTPSKGAASPDGLHPGLSDEEWIRRREKELRDRRN